MEAMACGVPIFCTDTGNTAELLKANNSGVIVGTKQYNVWKEKLVQFLNGEPIKTIDISIVKQYYDWSNVAKEFCCIYNKTVYESK